MKTTVLATFLALAVAALAAPVLELAERDPGPVPVPSESASIRHLFVELSEQVLSIRSPKSLKFSSI